MINEDTYCYSERQIAELIPTIWSMEAKLNPSIKPQDPEMPKGPSADPSHSGDHMVHCADIDRAWRLAPLTLKQKQVLLLRYGMNWTQQEVAEHFDTSHQAVSAHEARGIKNIKTFLNGTEEREDYEKTNE